MMIESSVGEEGCRRFASVFVDMGTWMVDRVNHISPNSACEITTGERVHECWPSANAGHILGLK